MADIPWEEFTIIKDMWTSILHDPRSVHANASGEDKAWYRLGQQKWIILSTNPNKSNWEKILPQTVDQY